MPNYNTQLQTNNSSLEEIITQLNNMPDADEGGLDTSDATATSGDILSGKTAYVKGSKITGNIASATQATPTISVNSSGLITASAAQTAGYVAAGTKSSTYQLAFQAAKTITPSSTNQIAVSSGYYTGGNITVAGDSNLVASNIKSGVSIFGVSGNYEGSGGGSSSGETEDAIITRTIGAYTNDRVTNIESCAFYRCSNLTTVSFPEVTYIGGSAFANCSNLTTVSFPKVTNIGYYAFADCSKLTTVSFPSCRSISSSAFGGCTSLTTISFPICSSIGAYAFSGCSKLAKASFPACSSIGHNAFYFCASLTTATFPTCSIIGGSAFDGCSKLTTISFPVCSRIEGYAFYRCSKLTTASFPSCRNIGSSAFANCYNLTKLYLKSSSLCTLSKSNAFSSTPIGGYSTSAGTYGSIYVPSSLLTSYKTATNWSYFSSRFVGI